MPNKTPTLLRVTLAALVVAAGTSAGLAQDKLQPSTTPAKPKPAEASITGQKPVQQPNDPKAAEDIKAQHGLNKSSSADPKDSPVTWETMSHDWGIIDDTQSQEFAFKFTNNTDRDIDIRSLHGSCGCTTATLTKKLYKPGESGEIVARFDPKKRRGDNDKTVTVVYADENVPNTLLQVHAFVQPLVLVDPVKSYLPRVERKEGATTVVTVRGLKKDFRVTGVDVDSDWVTVAVGDAQNVSLDGQELVQVDLTVSVAPGAPAGPYSATLNITTNDDRVTLDPHLVSFQVIGDLAATPERMVVQETLAGAPFVQQIRLWNRAGQTFQVLSAHLEPGGVSTQDTLDGMSIAIDVESRAINGEDATFIRVLGFNPTTPGIETAMLVIKTDAGDGEELRVPFNVRVNKAIPDAR